MVYRSQPDLRSSVGLLPFNAPTLAKCRRHSGKNSTQLRGKRNMLTALNLRVHTILWADEVIFLTIQHSTLKGNLS